MKRLLFHFACTLAVAAFWALLGLLLISGGTP